MCSGTRHFMAGFCSSPRGLAARHFYGQCCRSSPSAFVEKIAFNTSHFATFLLDRLTGGTEAMTTPGGMPIDPGMHLTLGRYLSTPGLWIGLAFTALCLAGAVRLRRYRGPF